MKKYWKSSNKKTLFPFIVSDSYSLSLCSVEEKKFIITVNVTDKLKRKKEEKRRKEIYPFLHTEFPIFFL